MEHPLNQRSAGVLMHISSLPARYGIGDCGPAAFAFVDFLKQAGQSWWQMLPLGPMGMGYSPFQTFSAFAASALWISPDALRKEGWLKASDLTDYPDFPKRRVDYAAVSREKHRLLGVAFGRFLADPPARAFRHFEEEHEEWLEDYALFTALQQLQRRVPWTSWPVMLRRGEREAVSLLRQVLGEKVAFQKFLQFLFFRQWKALKTYARQSGVGLIGEVPFFVPLDSADVWAHRELFDLNTKMGGHPVYHWEAHRDEGYAWWIHRIKHLFQLFDVLRLDYFSGFQRHGGNDFFKAIFEAVPHAAFIADDLGPVTPDVTALRMAWNIPGMSVQQFAFSGDPAKNLHLPDRLAPHTVVYTGTHDHNTTKGWFTVEATEKEIQRVRQYLNRPTGPVHWPLIRLPYSTPANTAIIPMQDLLGLGHDARMNTPGRLRGNWLWRMTPDASLDTVAKELRVLAERYDRLPGTRRPPVSLPSILHNVA